MEGVPKLPMLKFEFKLSPDNGEFLTTIKKLVKAAYNEDPDTFTKEVEEISKLRSNSCIRPKEDVTGVADIKRYYAQLHLLQNRFKIESGDKGPFNFSWSDPYAGTIYTLPDFDYELASVLYNLGSLHTSLGAAEKRDTSESMKVACTHFQCAAWAFHTLPDKYPKVYTPDISPDLMAVLSQICLAQAQECILEKSILDHRKSTIISKVGAQVSDYYFAALHKLETSNARHLTSDILLMGGAPPGEETVMESIGHKNNSNWVRQIEFKFVYHKAIAHLYAGLNSEESQKMGERITHFQAAMDKLMECAKLTKYAGSNNKDSGIWKEALTFSNDVIQGKLENAKKENEFIYHEKVPDQETLIELKGASLVKGIGFEVTDPEVAGKDIFGRLVPMEAHEASSLYSEEKAKLLRKTVQEIESKNNELAVFMSSMSLDEDGVVPKPDECIALPQELIEVAASLSVQGEDNVTVHLKNAMSRIAAVSAEVETSLKEIKEILNENKEQETEYETIMNPHEGQTKASGRELITEEITRECEKYQGAHKMASDSNSTLHNAIKLHMDNLKLLTLPLEQLQKEIPSMADLDEDSESNIAEVRRILSKVEEMKEQRLKLEESFRRQLMEDDITKKLVLHKDKQMPEIFEIELQKHEQAKKVITQNLLAQANIMKALTEVNAKYVDTRRTISELTNSRNEMIGSLVASFYAHEDLLHKATKGLEFYDKLDSNVTKLLHRVQGVVKVHQEERDAILAKNAPARSIVGGNQTHDKFSYYPPSMMPINSVAPMSNEMEPISTTPFSYPVTDLEDHRVESSTANIETFKSSPKSSNSGKPTLKDYLKIMKETKNDASAAYAAINFPDMGTKSEVISDSSQDPTQISIPNVRLPPLGSESEDSCSSMQPSSMSMPISQQSTNVQNMQVNQQTVNSQQYHMGQLNMANNTSLAHSQISNSMPQAISMASANTQLPVQYSNVDKNVQMMNMNPETGMLYKVPNSENTRNGDTRTISSPHQVTQGNSQYTQQAPFYPNAYTSAHTYPSNISTNSAPPQQTLQSFPGTSLQKAPENIVDSEVAPNLGNQTSQITPGINYGARYSQPCNVSSIEPYTASNPPYTFQNRPPQPNYQPQTGPNSNFITQSGYQNIPYGYQPNIPIEKGNRLFRETGHNTAIPIASTSQQIFNRSQPNTLPHVAQVSAVYATQSFNQSLTSSGIGQMSNITTSSTGANSSKLPQVPNYGGYYNNAATYPNVQMPQASSQASLINQTPSSAFQHQSITHTNVQQLPGPTPSISMQRAQSPIVNQVPSSGYQHQSIAHPNAQQVPTPSISTQRAQSPIVNQAPSTAYQHQNITYPNTQHVPTPSIYTQRAQSPIVNQVSSGGLQPQGVTHPNIRQVPSPSLNYSSSGASQQTPIQGYQSQQTPLIYSGNMAQQPVLQPQRTQSFPQSVHGYSPATQLATIQNPGYIAVTPQQTHPVTSNPPTYTPHTQFLSHGTVTSNPIPINNPEIKLKPIVPQPGTAPMVMNVNNGMRYEAPISSQCPNNPPNNVIQNQHTPIVPNINQSFSNITNQPSVRRSSSFDDMLNNEVDENDAASSVVTLQPKIMTAKELAEQKREAQAVSDIVQATNRDPYDDENAQKKLLEEVNSMERSLLSDIDGNSELWLNEKWKVFNTCTTIGSVEGGDVALGGGTLSVARCYPMKNRAPDVLPFDNSRVELPTTKDDYINASYIRHLSPHSPNFIATQWPPLNTHNDFWTMVWQEQIEIIVCLLGEPPNLKDIYWPTTRKEPMKITTAASGGGASSHSLDITLQSVKSDDGQLGDGKTSPFSTTERILTVLNNVTNTSRVVIHIQLAVNVNSSGKPLIRSLSDLASVCLGFHRQQRVLTHPILLHCLDGSDRTASFALMVAAISEIDIGIGATIECENSKTLAPSHVKDADHELIRIMPDLVKMAALMAQQRKGILRERHHFKHAYEGMLLHARSILVRKGILQATETIPCNKSNKTHDYQDTIGSKLTEPGASTDSNCPDYVDVVDNHRKEHEQKSTETQETGKSSELKAKKTEAVSNFFSAELLTNTLSDLNLSDPLSLTTSSHSPHRKRITKQDFLNASNSSISNLGKGASDDADPLSQLDPLWSMK